MPGAVNARPLLVGRPDVAKAGRHEIAEGHLSWFREFR
jgi:hypothetical protein